MQTKIICDRAGGILLALLVGLTVCVEWGLPGLVTVQAVTAAAIIALFAPQLPLSRIAFVAVGLLLTLWCVLQRPDWLDIVTRGFGSAAFIGAFFSALVTLRSVAQTSPAITRAGEYLASQPPGRRYVALSLGGHMFALMLGYGAISLLGSLATGAAGSESDPVLRGHRVRRMLLAIQRGFVSTLPWSPLSFAMAITTVLIPGATWRDAVQPGIVTALILFGIGWALDTLLKPRLAVQPPRRTVKGTIRRLQPLLVLLALMAVLTEGLHILTEVRIVGVVLVVVPLIALIWAVVQDRGDEVHIGGLSRLRAYLFDDLPGYRGEIVLLMMAGYIGTLGAPLLAPVMAGLGLDLALLPTWLLLILLVGFIPLLGQVGMNPILAVTLIAPLIPAPSALGITPSALVTAITAGWAISGTCSPFTATTLLVGAFGGVSPRHVGLRWNGAYVAVIAVALCAWVLTYAFLLAPV